MDWLALLEPPACGRRFYAGVGSRETPADVLALMKELARKMEQQGWILRSGGADGADLAFESGVGDIFNKQVFLPYPGFNGSTSKLSKILPACYDIAADVHPAWERCSGFARKAHARNVFQVMGYNLREPSAMVVCWTKDGAIDAATAHKAGGTRTAIVLAAKQGIPVCNLQRAEHRAAIERWLGLSPAISVQGTPELDFGSSPSQAPRGPKQ
jgi:hypothetical protein